MPKSKLIMREQLLYDLSDSFEEFGITNIFIDSFLRENCMHFIGVFAPDTLPKTVKRKGSLVCNLSDSSMIGSHFITIILQPERVLYIDSFGTKCENNQISLFMKSFRRPIFYNVNMIQDIGSHFCGFFCILFCMYYDKKRLYALRFYQDLKKNDALCVDLINDLKN